MRRLGSKRHQNNYLVHAQLLLKFDFAGTQSRRQGKLLPQTVTAAREVT